MTTNFGLYRLTCLTDIDDRPWLIEKNLGSDDAPQWTRMTNRDTLTGAIGYLLEKLLRDSPEQVTALAVQNAFTVARGLLQSEGQKLLQDMDRSVPSSRPVASPAGSGEET